MRAIIDHPDLELVGLWVHSDAKVGKDAGSFCGLDPVGVAATSDKENILALDADCVCYMATDIGRDPAEIVDDLVRILASGKNIVSTQTGLGYPIAMGASVAERIADACATGNASLYGTGIQPDGCQALMVALASLSRPRSVEFHEMYTVEHYNEPVFLQGVGIGIPSGTLPREQSQAMNNLMMRPLIMLLANGLGCEIDDFRHSHCEAVADSSFEVAAGTIGKGMVSAVHNTLEGIVNGVPRIISHQYYWVGQYPGGWAAPPDPNGYRLVVNAESNLTLDFTQSGEGLTPLDANLIASAWRTVNSIPVVCAAQSGIQSLFTLPLIRPSLDW
jgi:hypothetical protein